VISPALPRLTLFTLWPTAPAHSNCGSVK
jgi:hypothetical protein